MIRHLWVRIHRYAGLIMTAFLIVVGLTGSLLAFLPELNRLLTPQLFRTPKAEVALKAADLIESALALYPNAQFNAVNLSTDGTAIIIINPGLNPADGKTYQPNFNQLFLDPYNGLELGRRMVGDWPDGLDNLMPFIYKLHYALALGDTGTWILGAVAVVWTIDCFIGLYLTLPARQGKLNISVPIIQRKAYWQRWLPAWKIRWKANSCKLNFDLHRAGGLWVWLALLVFAWSSVMFNMKSVYMPVTAMVFDYPNPKSIWGLPKLEKPLQQPKIDWRQAQEITERLLAEHAQLHHFSVKEPVSLNLNRALGFYAYWVRSSLDVSGVGKGGNTVIAIDANTGEFKGLHLPSGQHSGHTVTNWLVMLHMGRVFGLPYRIFICVLGLMIVMLSVTGVIIWLRKRRAYKLKASVKR